MSILMWNLDERKLMSTQLGLSQSPHSCDAQICQVLEVQFAGSAGVQSRLVQQHRSARLAEMVHRRAWHWLGPLGIVVMEGLLLDVGP